MRFGTRRVMIGAAAMAAFLAAGPGGRARAGDLFHTIPREVPALDYRTGDVMYAPAVPGGCYTKDPIGCLTGAAGLPAGLLGKLKGCALCGGAGCSSCRLGLGLGCGLGDGCGDPGCGLGRRGLFHKHKACGADPCGFAPVALPSKQTPVVPSGQEISDPCGKGFLHGKFGKGACGGLGLLHCGKGDPGCDSCGGRGCGLCDRLRGLGHGGLGLPIPGLGHGKVKYFMGAGGPVPITPGYVNWVNPIRSPRDYFAFPPFTDTLP